MKRTWWKIAAVLLTFALVAAACGDEDDATTAEPAAPAEEEAPAEEPAADEPVEEAMYSPDSPECIAPSDPGGGWDFTCRSIGQLFEDMGLASNVIITNQPGGGGGVAFADMAANRMDENDLVIAASPATAIRFGQNQYAGLEADQFRWIGAIGADFGVIAYRPTAHMKHSTSSSMP